MSADSTASVPLNKSLLFTFFNKARSKAAGLDRKRVNRALGYIQAGRVVLLPDGNAIAKSENDTYWISRDGGDCGDHVFRGKTCKHQISRFILLRMQQAEDSKPVAATVAAMPAPTLQDNISLLWGTA